MLRYRDFFPLGAEADTSARQGHGISLEDALPLGILVTDRDGKCIYSNIAYQKLCGWTGEELIGSHWSAVIHPGCHERTVRHWNNALLGREPFMCEARLQRSDGEVLWVRRNAALLTDNLPNLGYVHTIEDISAYKTREIARDNAAPRDYPTQHDALTGLHSRNAFYGRFEQSRAQAIRHKNQMGLMYIHLDNFRGINDARGQDVGDSILVELAGRLKKRVRAADTVCRHGNDEFVVLLGEIAERDHAFAVADQIRETASARMVVHGHEVALKLSIGVSVYPDNGMTADELLKKAKTIL